MSGDNEKHGVPRESVLAPRKRLRLRDIFGDSRSGGAGQNAQGQPRRIVLAGQAIDYRLFRVRRRSIGMQISVAGLTVRAPPSATIREIEASLTACDLWILRSLAEWRARQRDVFPSVWKTGAPIIYLGRELALAVHAGRNQEIFADLLNLTILHPAAQDEGQVAACVVRWVRDETERLLIPRVAELARRITAHLPVVKLSKARSEWGSCSQDGVIRLSWRLAQLPPDLALYVVAHEVAHLVELNHSPRFWALVEQLFPGHARARQALDDWTALLEA